MTVFTSTISSILSLLSSSLQLAAIFPAMVFVVANYLFILPYFTDGALVSRVSKLDVAWQAAMVLAIVGVVGYTLTALNIPIIRFFEGYPFQDSLLGKLLMRFQKYKRNTMLARQIEGERERVDLRSKRIEVNRQKSKEQITSEEAQKTIAKIEDRKVILEAQIRATQAELEQHFPSSQYLLPTGLGNIVAAFEEYPQDRYGADAVLLWPRLTPFLDKQGYAPFVEREKTPLDFLLNLTVLTGIFTIEYTYASLYFDGEMPWVKVTGLALVAYAFYRMAQVAARQWGATVCVAFDLYRQHLWQGLSLKPPKDFDKEKKLWSYLSSFIAYSNQPALWQDYFQRASDKTVAKLSSEGPSQHLPAG